MQLFYRTSGNNKDPWSVHLLCMSELLLSSGVLEGNGVRVMPWSKHNASLPSYKIQAPIRGVARILTRGVLKCSTSRPDHGSYSFTKYITRWLVNHNCYEGGGGGGGGAQTPSAPPWLPPPPCL